MPRKGSAKQRRRGNGEGTITQRANGTWVAAFYRPDGTRKYYTAKTRDAVANKLLEGLTARKDGLPIPDERVTVAAFLDYWLATMDQLHLVRRGTWISYESYVRLHLKPGLGRLRLAHLSVPDLQEFMARGLKSGLSVRTVRYCRNVLRIALNEALRYGLVARNVAALASPPKGHRPKPPAPLTPEEGLRLVAGLEGERLGALHLVMLALGLRQGEALGLRWSDVDLDGGMCHVRQSLKRLEGQYTLEEPKTDKSRRDLPMDDFLIGVLRGHQTRQKEEQLASKHWRNHWNLVFTTADGDPVHYTSAGNDFKRILEKLGIEKRRHYDLRHSAASYLINQGAELRDVMEQLGHSQISLTANTYSHLFAERKRSLAVGMGNFLRQGQKPPNRAG